MADTAGPVDNFIRVFSAMPESVSEQLPGLAAAVLLLLLGWLAARLLRRLTLRLGHGINALLDRIGRSAAASGQVRLTSPVLKLAGDAVFWLTILIFIALAARAAQLHLFTDWLDRLSAFVPTLAVGALIVLAGFLAGALVRDVVTATMKSAGSKQGERFGLMAQGAVFLTAVVIGLDQIGIDVLFLTILFALAVAGVVLSLALAFGLGASAFVANLLGANQAQRTISPGETVRICGHEGEVIEFTSSGVILATEQGRLIIPGRTFQEEAALILAAEFDDSEPTQPSDS